MGPYYPLLKERMPGTSEEGSDNEDGDDVEDGEDDDGEDK